MAENPDPVDIHVGKQVKKRRNALSMSQEKLGKALGLTFQQVQKYERGVNRIGSSRLYQLSQILDMDITYFFEGYADAPEESFPMVAEDGAGFDHEAEQSPETLEVLRTYYRITDAATRRKLLDLMRAMAS